MRPRSERLKHTRGEIAAILLGAAILQRYLTVWCAKAAAFYVSRGDERQAARFESLARHFARMSYMYGELD